MYALISGISDTDYINFCPKCGEPIRTHCGDGTAKCESCGFRFGVVADDDENSSFTDLEGTFLCEKTLEEEERHCTETKKDT